MRGQQLDEQLTQSEHGSGPHTVSASSACVATEKPGRYRRKAGEGGAGGQERRSGSRGHRRAATAATTATALRAVVLLGWLAVALLHVAVGTQVSGGDGYCHLNAGDFSEYPVAHNCSSVPPNGVCVVECDVSAGFEGGPMTVFCGPTGQPVPFRQLVCTALENQIVTSAEGIRIVAYQGDVIAQAGGREVGVNAMNERLMGVESTIASTLNVNTTSLAMEVSQLAAERLPTRVSTLASGLASVASDAAHNTSQLRSELQERALKQDVEAALSNLAQNITTARTSLASEIGALQARADDHDGNIANHEDRLSSVESAIAALPPALTKINAVTSGIGSASRPGRTCSHIAFERSPEMLPDGPYWIDPNGGSIADAFQAFCNMTAGGETVIAPAANVTFMDYRDGSVPEERAWFASPSFGGSRFTYEIADDQLNALIQHSTSARQTATFSCRGVVIWKTPGGSIDPNFAAWFRAFQDTDDSLIWKPYSSVFPAPQVPLDDCSLNSGSSRLTTMFEFETNSPQFLPIVDISLTDDGASEYWGLDYGPVSFSYDFPDGRTCGTRVYPSGAIFRSKTDNTGVYWTHPSRFVSQSVVLEPIITHDGCATNDIHTAAHASFVFATTNALALPIQDIALFDHGSASELIGFGFGATRFKLDFTRTPRGASASNPARTCADILVHTANPADGWYWIAPTASAAPAYLACDFTNGGWTGIPPTRRIRLSSSWFSSSPPGQHWWFSSVSGGFEVPYPISPMFLTALRRMSVEAKQEIVIHCGDYAVWYGTTHGSALGTSAMFKSDTITWSASSDNDALPTVDYVSDACRFDFTEESTTPFQLRTFNTAALPIIDVAVYAYDATNKLFGADIGIAWFR
ncbi:hypothetical protein PTSG_11789 [Salpingoeca rosetta]|uniref:Fibrillar collagen NC1 domain-containing protein n=1 Tax=Salpingoeca rosetta (strain ATCC 50818 / BSB-021) TaxID=946362 RepID=F2TZ55_SALR5|nr:uncharacterized protein PTSG_11789 [Salpingoeca rosetta]EGD78879.1 hypothetical protein PTSG_11789 [Salpingoeca rosetta]|eukprot:XP_004997835.1 hypothetical protein PTSG_11789 [Salpingoeca rosetta]